jgi:hypothetical protein
MEKVDITINAAHAEKSEEVRHTHPPVFRPWEPAIPPIIHQIFLDGQEEYAR